jgi:ATP-dependent DNA ligase
MLHFIHEICKAKAYGGQEVLYLHQKLDGHRVTVLRQPRSYDGKMAFYTRASSDLFPQMYEKARDNNIWPWIADLLMVPEKTSIDGELLVPGRPASYVKTAIKQCDPALTFVAFAVPWYEGVRRYTEPLEEAMDICTRYRITFADFIKLSSVKKIDPEFWIKRTPSGTEGWVAKRHHYGGWYKIKGEKTIDLIVLGATEGKGKYKGLIGGLRCGAWDSRGEIREICVCSGMTDAERMEMSTNDPVGKVCEVKYQEVLSLGRLRHPNFVRWREDKLPNECTLAQDPALLTYWNERA